MPIAWRNKILIQPKERDRRLSTLNGTILAERYRVERSLGRGTFAETVLASDLRVGGHVAVKVLDAKRVADLKTLELFDREVAVLRSLRHQAIPAVVESFRAETPTGMARCLAMEYVDGDSLATVIESGRRLDRATVMRWFLELLGVLDYLHTRVPSVLHRDIKPANIIVRPDGSTALVDFGSVRTGVALAEGSTVAGTYGYMAYEQYMGQASPSSDLYGLAATFLHVLTGTPPARFLGDQGAIEVPTELPCGEPMTRVIRRLLRTAPGDRYSNAAAARDALLGGDALETPPAGFALTSTSATGVLRSSPVTVPNGPRAIAGEIRTLYRRIAPGTWRWLNAGEKPGSPGVADVVVIGLFSALTFGMLPLWFASLASSRRRRVRPFLERGVLTRARILEIAPENVGFEVKVQRVRYQFQVGDRLIRSSDQVLPSVAERWQVGEDVEVLYLVDRDFDSIIVSS